MTRPYTIDGARYNVQHAGSRGWTICGNRNAAGMEYTRRRSHHGLPHPRSTNGRQNLKAGSSIAFRGTLDALAPSLFYPTITRGPCPCCGAKQGGKSRLTPRGREKLARMRQRKANRSIEP